MRRILPIAVFALGMWASSTARAEAPRRSWQARLEASQVRMWPKAVASEILLGETAEAAGETDEAIEHYQRASQLPGSGVDGQVELGLAYLRVGRFLEAAQVLGDVSLQEKPSIRPSHTAREALDEAKQHVGAVKIYVSHDDAKVSVDGHVLSWFAARSTIYVGPGEHEIKAEREGFWPSQHKVRVEMGEERTVLIMLTEKIEMKIVGIGRPIKVFNNINPAKVEPPPTWPMTLMVTSGVGMGIGMGALVTGVLISNKATGTKADTWLGVAIGGGLVSATSLTGLIIGAAGIAARPPVPPVLVQPAMEGRGIAVEGRF